MACFYPLIAFRGPVGKSGKASVVFDKRKAISFKELELPCGQCIGCRLERSRQWAVRCVHEAQLHSENCVVTLTYSNDFLPSDESVHVEHFQNFMKYLRKAIYPRKVRFFHCGEYGKESVDADTGEYFPARPHYHACLFGYDFEDKVEVGKSKTGTPLYTSKFLEKLWTKGISKIGVLDFESAAYVARYITKKVTGDGASEHYGDRKPEYITMSRRPGIGSGWYDKFSSDVFPNDMVVVRGSVARPPKFYYSRLEQVDPALFALIKAERERDESWQERDARRDHLSVDEEVTRARMRRYSRSLEA